MRVFERYGGREVFAGEAEIADRPVGLPVELTIGRALNVMLEVTTDPSRNGGRVVATTEHRIVNNKSVPIDLEIRHGVEACYTDVEVDRTSRPMRRKYGDLAWRFVVPPGEEQLQLPAVGARAAVTRVTVAQSSRERRPNRKRNSSM